MFESTYLHTLVGWGTLILLFAHLLHQHNTELLCALSWTHHTPTCRSDLPDSF
jgi:hypothetical protein